MRKKLMVATAMLMAGSLFAAGCVQQGAAEGESSSTEVQYQNSIEEAEAYLDGVNERQDELNKEYAPEIRTLEDGTKVQRTPTEYQCYHWNRPYEGGTSYNNYYLDADNRGCGACHEDLGDALANMEYSHPTVWNDALGSKITVDQCACSAIAQTTATRWAPSCTASTTANATARTSRSVAANASAATT